MRKNYYFLIHRQLSYRGHIYVLLIIYLLTYTIYRKHVHNNIHLLCIFYDLGLLNYADFLLPILLLCCTLSVFTLKALLLFFNQKVHNCFFYVG